MMVVILVAGIGLILAGLLAIGLGIPIKEFSTGNTLIVVGGMGVCTGAIMLAIWAAVRELRHIGLHHEAEIPASRAESAVRPVLPPGIGTPEDGGVPPNRDQPSELPARVEPAVAAAPPPWQGELPSRDRAAAESPAPAIPAESAAPAAKPKRNLLFSSSSRKERERAQARGTEPLTPDLLSPDLRPSAPAVSPPAIPAEPPSFDDAWPKADRAKPGDVPPQRRPPRAPSTFSETNGAPVRSEEQPAVTVLKSGVVDGMAYSLYSDGSIEAQMPEGMMRFASIDELRTHLDQRP